MRTPFSMGVLLLGLIPATGCGPERNFTGVWRLEACAEGAQPDDPGPCPDDPFMYELHLGRYGDEVTGLLVRYRYAFADLSFDPTHDCGCNFVVGGRADDDSIHFQIHDPTTPGCRDPQASPDPACGEPSPVVDCRIVRIDLRGDDDVLEGTIACCNDERSLSCTTDEETREEYTVRFRREGGRPRTRCQPCTTP